MPTNRLWHWNNHETYGSGRGVIWGHHPKIWVGAGVSPFPWRWTLWHILPAATPFFLSVHGEARAGRTDHKHSTGQPSWQTLRRDRRQPPRPAPPRRPAGLTFARSKHRRAASRKLAEPAEHSRLDQRPTGRKRSLRWHCWHRACKAASPESSVVVCSSSSSVVVVCVVLETAELRQFLCYDISLPTQRMYRWYLDVPCVQWMWWGSAV